MALIGAGTGRVVVACTWGGGGWATCCFFSGGCWTESMGAGDAAAGAAGRVTVGIELQSQPHPWEPVSLFRLLPGEVTGVLVLVSWREEKVLVVGWEEEKLDSESMAASEAFLFILAAFYSVCGNLPDFLLVHAERRGGLGWLYVSSKGGGGGDVWEPDLSDKDEVRYKRRPSQKAGSLGEASRKERWWLR